RFSLLADQERECIGWRRAGHRRCGQRTARILAMDRRQDTAVHSSSKIRQRLFVFAQSRPGDAAVEECRSEVGYGGEDSVGCNDCLLITFKIRGQNQISELDNEVVRIGSKIPLQLLEGLFVLPFSNELSAMCEYGKRTLTLEFALQPTLRQRCSQPS